ncbi:MAG: YbaB/EbfC family nucleoid-associated protein [Bacteroidia bacterium]
MWDFLKALQKIQELAQLLEQVQVTGEGAGGKVRITISGHQEVVDVYVAPEALASAEGLADGIKAAFRDAREKLQKLVLEKLGIEGLPPIFPGGIGLG